MGNNNACGIAFEDTVSRLGILFLIFFGDKEVYAFGNLIGIEGLKSIPDCEISWQPENINSIIIKGTDNIFLRNFFVNFTRSLNKVKTDGKAVRNFFADVTRPISRVLSSAVIYLHRLSPSGSSRHCVLSTEQMLTISHQ